MNELLSSLGLDQLLSADRALALGRALLVFGAGLALSRLIAAGVQRLLEKRIGKPQSVIARRFTYYTLFMLVSATALHQLGFQLSVLLGAAGILTVAIGFASQTSASNLISGLFLIAERPFVVGDIISVDGTTGEVLSIDLLSVKLRTFDNLYVRIPNESLIKTQVTNFSHFPIRRADLAIGVAYKEDLTRVERILRETARANPLCLEDPAPILIVKGFGSSSIDLQFSVWGERSSFLDMRNGIWMEIKDAFDRQGIEIPFPHVSVYAGSATGPLPVRLQSGADE